MENENPLSYAFLLRYPVEAARVLEQLPKDTVAALLSQCPLSTSVPILTAMLPSFASTTLSRMGTQLAAKLLNEISVTHAARIYRLMNAQTRKELGHLLTARHRYRIRRILKYIHLAVGDFMDANVQMLVQDLTVADAVRRIRANQDTRQCEIYVVDQGHRFVGVISMAQLLVAKNHVRIRDLMNRGIQSVYVHTSMEKLWAHPGWKVHARLPVIDADHILVGVLDYPQTLAVTETEAVASYDPMENLLSLAAMYWLSLVQLLDSILNIATSQKRSSE